MANTQRHIDLAVGEVMETEAEAQALIALIHDAKADGEITLDEARAILSQAHEVLREAREDLQAVERANIAELVMASNLKAGGISPYLLKRAADVGLQVAIPLIDVSTNAGLQKTA